MSYLIAIVLIGAIVYFLYRVIVAPAEETIDLKKGAEAKLPDGVRAVQTFPSDAAQTFTNEHSRLLESAKAEGFGPAASSAALKFAIKSGGWLIVHLPLGGADWKGQRRLHVMGRGAKAPTAVRVVAQTDAGEFFAWHDTAFAAADWFVLSIPFSKLVDGGNRAYAGQPVRGLNLEIHPDRKMALRGEEERQVLLGGVWLSA